MYAKGYISREEEAKIPEFTSHEEARSWFKEKYGDRFMMTGSEDLTEGKVYFYRLILDEEKHEELQRRMAEDGYVIGMAELTFSFQSIEVFSDGSIHVIH